jgi:hypothetical protein
MTLQPADLEALFGPCVRYRLPHPDGADAEAVVELRDAGSLHLATGQLVACDPFWAPDSLAPFRAAVAPGRYPVTLSIARVDRPALLHLAEGRRRRVAKWSLFPCSAL